MRQYPNRSYVFEAKLRHSSRSADNWFRLLEDQVTGENGVMERRRKDNDKRVKVAILDSGIDPSHPEFSNHTFGDHNSRDWTGSSATFDRVGHGTHAAALVLRVAPKAELYIGKVFNSSNGDTQTPRHVAEVSNHQENVSFGA
jgi:subtilisin family serine protease